MTLSWKRVATVASVVAVALAGTLAIVARRYNADALATTALAVALMSFAAQLMISLNQFAAAARQQEESARIAAETKAALAGLQTLSGELSKAMQGQIDRLLDYALQDIQQTAETPEESDAADKLAERVREERVDRGPLLPAIARAPSRERELHANFAQFLSEAGLSPMSPPLGSRADIVWTDAHNRLHVAVVQAPEKPQYQHRRVIDRYAARASSAARALGGEEAVATLVLPFPPAFPEVPEVESQHGVIVVWPDTFERTLTS